MNRGTGAQLLCDDQALNNSGQAILELKAVCADICTICIMTDGGSPRAPEHTCAA
jgi:hypothetical protein